MFGIEFGGLPVRGVVEVVPLAAEERYRRAEVPRVGHLLESFVRLRCLEDDFQLLFQ